MNNLTKLHKIKELINQSQLHFCSGDRLELSEYIQEGIAIEEIQSSKLFTAEEVVNELKENETLDDAISFFTSVGINN